MISLYLPYTVCNLISELWKLGSCLYDGGDAGVWLDVHGQGVQGSEGSVSTTLILLGEQ